MKIFNPSGWTRTILSGGKEYTFEAFKESNEIWNMDHCEHIPRAYSHFGLVLLNYDEGSQKQYSTYDEYKSAQEIKGLKALLKWREDLLDTERNGELAAKANPQANSELRLFHTDKFEKDVALVKKWLKAAGVDKLEEKKIKEEVVAERPDWKKQVIKKETQATA